MIPKYIALKEIINEDILTGIYPLDSKLPTENELADKYNVSRSTVRQALELLVNDGIISKRWGSGNTVVSKSDSSKKNTIMLLFNTDSFMDGILEDITSTLMKEGFTIEFHDTSNSLSSEREYLLGMLSEIYSGLIIAPSKSTLPSTNIDLLQQLLKRQLPVVFLGTAPGGIYNPVIVSTDCYNKGYQMARSFINSGKKALGGIFLHDDISSVATFSGYVDAIRDAGLNIFDSCFLWSNTKDPAGINTRSSSFINKFLKHAYDTVEIIYVDDNRLNIDNSFPVFRCTLEPAKNLGKEAAKKLLELKKNGNASGITIPFH